MEPGFDETVADLCVKFQLQSRTDDPRTFLHHELGGPPHQWDTAYEAYYYKHAALLEAMRKKLQADVITRLEAEIERLKERGLCK